MEFPDVARSLRENVSKVLEAKSSGENGLGMHFTVIVSRLGIPRVTFNSWEIASMRLHELNSSESRRILTTWMIVYDYEFRIFSAKIVVRIWSPENTPGAIKMGTQANMRAQPCGILMLSLFASRFTQASRLPTCLKSSALFSGREQSCPKPAAFRDASAITNKVRTSEIFEYILHPGFLALVLNCTLLHR